MNRRGMSTVTLVVLICSILGVLIAGISVYLQYRNAPTPECEGETRTVSDEYREQASAICTMDVVARGPSLDAKCVAAGFDQSASHSCWLDGELRYKCMKTTKVCT